MLSVRGEEESNLDDAMCGDPLLRLSLPAVGQKHIERLGAVGQWRQSKAGCDLDPVLLGCIESGVSTHGLLNVSILHALVRDGTACQHLVNQHAEAPVQS